MFTRPIGSYWMLSPYQQLVSHSILSHQKGLSNIQNEGIAHLKVLETSFSREHLQY